jgi:hypothetical protein
MNDIKYKILFAFSVPYLTLCAGLWHIGYWSTFDINILQHLDTVDIIKSFIYPFITSVTLYFIGQFISYFLERKLEVGFAEDRTPAKKLKIIRYILLIIITLYVIAVYKYYGNDKWIWILFVVASFIGIFLNRRLFLSTIIPDINFRLNFVYTIVLIPCLCFAVAKKKSLDIFYDHNKQSTIVSLRNNQDSTTTNIKYKLLGFASNFVFVMTLDSKSIIMFPNSEIKQITIDKKPN